MASLPAGIPEARNQGLNFFGIGFLSVLSASVVHGLQLGPTWLARLDDLALAALALLAIGWYLSGRNRYRLSPVPLVALVLGVALKVGGIVLTYGRFVPAGADFGIAFYLLLAALIYAWRYFAIRREIS
ncbi:MAG TPA: hypothetical protein VEB59_16550 [Gemmatimonadales bacterium]|nr:hypothetical protein [Gemmatimonadales bacterium]